MRDYELTLILKPTLSEEALAAATQRIEGWVMASGGQLLNVVPVGRKRLAYPINHLRDGAYVVMQFKARPDVINEVERNLKLSEDVIRHLIVRQ